MFRSANVLNETKCVANLMISEIHFRVYMTKCLIKILVDDACSVLLRHIIDRPKNAFAKY